MRKLLVACCALAALAFDAHPSQIAFIALNVQSAAGGRLPPEWQIKINHGKPDISNSREGNESVIRLRSNRSSFALERAIDVDPATMPYLAWRWKVTELPAGADFRKASTDDQAAQILVAFNDRRVLTYIWDSNAPKGTMQSASAIPLVHVFAIVCRSGATELNQWINETRNVAEDYQRAYGRPAPHVKGLRLQINSQHTGSAAESYFGQVVFRNTAQ